MTTTLTAENADHFIENMATASEAVDEWRFNVGHEDRNIESAWLLHDRDVWVRNPYYTGPAQPHPEDDRGDFDSLVVARDEDEDFSDLIAVDDRYYADESRLEEQAEACDWLRAHEGGAR